MELLIGQQKHGQKKSGLLIRRKWAAEKIHELVQDTSTESSVITDTVYKRFFAN